MLNLPRTIFFMLHDQSHLATPPWCEHVPRLLWLKL